MTATENRTKLTVLYHIASFPGQFEKLGTRLLSTTELQQADKQRPCVYNLYLRQEVLRSKRKI